MTPTVTFTWTASPTRTRIPTSTATLTRTQTSTMTPTLTLTATLSPIPTGTPTLTKTPTSSLTPTLTLTPTYTPTITSTPTPSLTRSPTNTKTPSSTATWTQTPTLTSTPTDTATWTPTRTATLTRTATNTPTVTPTPTITLTPTITNTPTHTVPPEPVITFFGVTRADDSLLDASGSTEDGLPIYTRGFGSGFSLVIEGRPGGTNSPVGAETFNWNPANPSALPDLQVVVSRSLGNGSATVCDDTPPNLGGVPAVDPPAFSGSQEIADALNDLGCRFKNGSGIPGGRKADEACTIFPDGRFRFVAQRTSLQFCGLIDDPISFPPGDTVVTVRIRDEGGRLSTPASIVVRVGS
ncbi:MAG: hypothetical protein HY270_09625 [Deltaproteobacteria bacterium]|nr:hypothetical protein [Deltaproteobacteria bacterium]